MHKGLKRYFYYLSQAAQKVEERKHAKLQVHEHMQKIKTIAPRQWKMTAELTKLENHLAQVLEKKLQLKEGTSHKEKVALERLHAKEKELDTKVKSLNELLAKLGKKVDESKLKEQLGTHTKESSQLEQLEEKLYMLERKHAELRDKGYSESDLRTVSDKISMLKAKIREMRNRS